MKQTKKAKSWITKELKQLNAEKRHLYNQYKFCQSIFVIFCCRFLLTQNGRFKVSFLISGKKISDFL